MRHFYQDYANKWQKFKMAHRKRYDTHETLFSTYLVDFVWRREFYCDDVMYHLWSQIAEIYPVYGLLLRPNAVGFACREEDILLLVVE